MAEQSTQWTRAERRTSPHAEGAFEGTISYYEDALPSTMNPLYAQSMVDYRTAELVFDRLFFRSPITNEVTSRVVEDVELDGDGQGVTVTVWDDILWHDGEPLTADDICFTVDTILDPETVSVATVVFRDALATCTVSADERSATIRFVRPLFNPFDHLGFWVLPHHVFDRQDVSPDHDFSHRPVGTGPMRGSKGTRGVRLTAIPNAHQGARIAVVNQQPGGDAFVQIRTLMSKGVQGVVTVPPALRPEVQASADVALKSYDLRSWWFVAMNTTRGPLQDVRIREAIELSIDRTELRRLTVGHNANDPNPACEFISGPFVQSSPFYNRAITARPTADLVLAEQRMTEAGATKVAGVWHLDGSPVSLRVGMNASLDVEARDILNQLGNGLQGASFNQEVQRISADDWGTRAVTGSLTSEYDLLMGKWSFGLVEDVGSLFHTRSADGEGAQNIFNYSNPEVDAILARYGAARSDREAQDAYHELHALLADDLPYIFLWKLDTKSAWRNEVRGNTIAPFYYFTNFEGWRYDD